MFNFKSNIVTFPRLMAAALALIPVVAVSTMTTAGTLENPGFCDIGATSAGGGMVKLDALVHADRAVSGSYTFRVEKTGGGGSSTINQGGDFDAKAGQTATLSSVSLGSKGAQYRATLDVTFGGKTVSCTKETGSN
ncbi:MAG TPA: curli-like amyloid fiber formation chaperone CsgH [Ensifer sp.]|nr:curli-like amyloid fiber formation chaperone CsgH [Ensifer sp.]